MVHVRTVEVRCFTKRVVCDALAVDIVSVNNMNIVLKFLKWQFVPHGIVVVEESGRITYLEALKRMFSGAVRRDPNGPTVQERLTVLRVLKRDLKRYKCCVCGVRFWSWRPRKACFRWSCVRKAG